MSSENAEKTQELVVIDTQNQLLIASFEKEEGLNGLIDQIRQRAKQEPFDISTKEGRKKMRSFARFGIGSSKTLIVNMSDKLRADGKAKDKIIMLETDRMAGEVDKIRDDFLALLTDFENK